MNKQIYRILMVCTFAVALVATGCKKQTALQRRSGQQIYKAW